MRLGVKRPKVGGKLIVRVNIAFWFCHDRETTFHASFVGSKFSFSSMSWLPVFIFCRLGVLLGLSDKDRRAHIAWSNIKLYLRIVILQN